MESGWQTVRLADDRIAEATAMLGRAFKDDPAWRWIIPDPRRREALLPWLFRMGFDLLEAEVWAVAGSPDGSPGAGAGDAGRLLGAARWLPPGRPRMHVGAMLRAAVATPLRAREATPRFLAYGRAVEALRTRAAPWPHWYLAGIGVEPSAQRRGIGAALLRPGLAAADADDLPCALVTNTEENIRFYERHGFTVACEEQTPAGGPTAWALVRLPAARRSAAG